MDEQRTGRQLHRYRGRIAALTRVLQEARVYIAEAAGAGNVHASATLGRIDAALRTKRATGGKGE